MYQQIDIQNLSVHLSRLEAEIASIRKKIEALPQQPKQAVLREMAPTYNWVNKEALKEQFNTLFSNLGIQGDSIGAEALQKQMRQAGLDDNELSESIIAARENQQ
jgi:hypothetical protein